MKEKPFQAKKPACEKNEKYKKQQTSKKNPSFIIN